MLQVLEDQVTTHVLTSRARAKLYSSFDCAPEPVLSERSESKWRSAQDDNAQDDSNNQSSLRTARYVTISHAL